MQYGQTCSSRGILYQLPSGFLVSTLPPAVHDLATWDVFSKWSLSYTKIAMAWPNGVSSGTSQSYVLPPDPIRIRLIEQGWDAASLQLSVVAASALRSLYERGPHLCRAVWTRERPIRRLLIRLLEAGYNRSNDRMQRIDGCCDCLHWCMRYPAMADCHVDPGEEFALCFGCRLTHAP